MLHNTKRCMSESDDSCPICFEEYGKQPDGGFLCQDGKHNSNFAENCTHYFCVRCIRKMVIIGRCSCGSLKITQCPMCREDWTEYLESHYRSESDSEEEYWSDDDSDDGYDDDFGLVRLFLEV